MDLANNGFKVSLENSIFVSKDEEEKTGEFPAGIIAGGAEAVLNMNMDAKEIQCASQGADKCLFSVKKSEKFKSLF